MRDLVLLPGFMCDADLWRDMEDDLTRLGRVHHGNLYDDDSLEGMARRVLDAAPERFVLIGFSMGGFVARVLSLMAPERVAGVAFIASSARGYTEAEDTRKKATLTIRRVRTDNEPTLSRALHPDRERDPVLLERLRGMSRRLGKAVMARQVALVRHDGYAELERITCPALVVACRQDRLRRFEETERMAHHLPRARFEVIEDCGHMAPLEQPHTLAAILADWIDRERL
ncbi:alpha/beta fold hydrolase [Vineibacter terrae]|uniref:alpha/beta fold hydrolase n=1 Tax=Vineibacter terrae TaxID=2586908 RepID=UPI002E377CAC|nr:alpha/beta fold hydrolase [Vineibacter terrae]HEX2885946.1 alpha/beta fold hydrolase [Vineibacter terrae]